ncbi:trans-aconitate 2-methyltransferase [Kutzneria sp. 744]|uniref:class I SAM-dependent methyltransferase n=1 Tax=Kutzneria sp. (strain 744) TaxID=345341 RepID=UPI0003EEBB4A|nr:class I SAM-dependent methyltransferase [Kutzneria sp. 744]EWM13596.1 methyltransferase type 11 [Kutzneria sp. 744]
MTSGILSQAAVSGGYEEASKLLQIRDQDWVLGFAPPAPRGIIDLGCGTGSLLLGALERMPSIETVVGLEKSAHRLEHTRGVLEAPGRRVRLIEADLVDDPALDFRSDLVTMTAVLHWLHPDEDAALRWVDEHLLPGGVFLLTTYHPAADGDGFGGTDEVVREALVATGVPTESVPGVFDRAGVVPIGVRTLPTSTLADLLGARFTVDAVSDRNAVMRPRDAQEYQRFHAATFGTYYSRMAGPGREQDFFDALGEVAERRMRELGHVTDIPVRLWRCVKAAG